MPKMFNTVLYQHKPASYCVHVDVEHLAKRQKLLDSPECHGNGTKLSMIKG